MQVKQFLQSVTARFWVVPATMVIAAIVVSIGFTELDRMLIGNTPGTYSWLFSGTPDAARTMLSTIAAAAITVVSISFSITIIAMQQASTQFTTRVLRTFTSDRGNQTVLGIYLATFVYALLVLRNVSSDTQASDAFVPVLSITFAILLALIAIAMLVYFVHHVSTSLQATTVVSRIHQNFIGQIDQLYPEHLGSDVRDPANAEKVMRGLRKNNQGYHITAPRAGFVSKVNTAAIAKINTGSAKWVYIMVKTGDYVNEGQPIAEIYRYDPQTDDGAAVKAIQRAIIIGTDRSTTQDPLFTLRQLVDVALKSLSPGINDQTSAIYSLHYIGDGLKRISRRKLPSSKRTFDGRSTVFILEQPEWQTFINLSFTQIRNVAPDKIFVMGTLIDILGDLYRESSGQRRVPLLEQLHALEEHINQAGYIEPDRQDLLRRLRLVVHGS